MHKRLSLLVVPMLFLVLAGAGCGRPAVKPVPQPEPAQPSQTTRSFGSAVTLRIGRSATYEDGLIVRLNVIDDSRCPAGVQCIWEGELSPLLSVSGGSLGAAQEVRLGTSRTPQTTVGGYAFLLRSATETTATIVVSKSSVVAPPNEPKIYDDILIDVTSPQPNEVVKSPLTVTGEARGTWYFEATFPVKLLDANGKVLVAHYAQAQGEWMTSEFVPFSTTLTFETPTTATGTLVLEKDNPSGLPEHDDSRRIPVRFLP